jgi:hypothetical protein
LPIQKHPATGTSRKAEVRAGRRKMHALQRQIHHVWMATTQTESSLHSVDAETVSIDLASALVTIRTLDLEVFGSEFPGPRRGIPGSYEKHRSGCREGRIVRGFTLIRNAEAHVRDVIDVDVIRMINMGDEWRVFPAWKQYADLPRGVTSASGTALVAKRAYREVIGGELVIETLLDALKFFLACDPKLARRDDNGELEYFPLPEFVQHDYERRHPDWPTRVEYQQQARAAMMRQPPTGTGREICHRLSIDGITVYAGVTTMTSAYMSYFIETADQIITDIKLGYPYSVAGDLLTVDSDKLLKVGADELDAIPLAKPVKPNEETLRNWFQDAQNNATAYHRQRYY